MSNGWMIGVRLAPKLEIGDVVEIDRIFYKHWGVYIGVLDGVPSIAHISPDNCDNFDKTGNKCSSRIVVSSKATICIDPFSKMANDVCRINNDLDKTHRPFPESIIKYRATAVKLYTDENRSIENICEHFPLWCRYGSEVTNKKNSENNKVGLVATALEKFGWIKAENLVDNLETGDLVEIDRIIYKHWVIYIGIHDGVHSIAHMFTDNGDLEAGSSSKKCSAIIFNGSTAAVSRNGYLSQIWEKGNKIFDFQFYKRRWANFCSCRSTFQVRIDPFLEVANIGLCRINNGLDQNYRPFPASEIKERVLEKLGTGGYHLIQNNCEHFAKWCRYGDDASNREYYFENNQVRQWLSGAVALGMTVATRDPAFGLRVYEMAEMAQQLIPKVAYMVEHSSEICELFKEKFAQNSDGDGEVKY